ncbi:MAG TPA: serine/threonine-protein kinase [Polyangiaceae bacterium]|nr:serine/threonine-protein kinase [Polyangiaceae bacterium]
MALLFTDASEPRYKSGDIIAGKYQLEGLLGEGGMGVVWGAINLQLEAPVAIKLLSQKSREERELLTQRLKQEAKAAAKLGHPAIVRIFDVGESELGDPFIVMERLKGRSLAAWLAQEGPMPAILAVRILLPIADALSAAHAKGIVHRDLKPDNVFIDESEQLSPKLVDFGIVKLTDSTSEQTHLTQSGMVLGSPEYMSPEQARGRDDLDARTDVWSFCVVLYEAVSGRTPFAAANSNALLVSIALDDPRPFEAQNEQEAGLWAIIQKGLAKDRALRFQSMVELGRALATWLIAHGVHEDACGASLEAKWIARSTDTSVARHSLATSPVLVVTPPGSAARAPSNELEVAATHAYPGVTVTPSTARERSGTGSGGAGRVRVGLALAGGLLIAAIGAFALSSPARESRVLTLRPAQTPEHIGTQPPQDPVKGLVAAPRDREREHQDVIVEPAAAESVKASEVAAPSVAASAVVVAPSVRPEPSAAASSALVAPRAKAEARAPNGRAARPAKSAEPRERASSDLISPY